MTINNGLTGKTEQLGTARLAQSVEHETLNLNLRDVGASPTLGAIYMQAMETNLLHPLTRNFGEKLVSKNVILELRQLRQRFRTKQ